MGLRAFAAAIATYLVGAAAALAVVRGLGLGSPTVALVAGAILGTQVAAAVHFRQPGATSSAGVKAALGVTLALTAAGFVAVAQGTLAAFEHVSVALGAGAIGGFVFPFVLFDAMWKALSKDKKAGRRP